MPVHVGRRERRDHTDPTGCGWSPRRSRNVEFTVWQDAGHVGLAKHFAEVLRETVS
jgi:hypothetical protein